MQISSRNSTREIQTLRNFYPPEESYRNGRIVFERFALYKIKNKKATEMFGKYATTYYADFYIIRLTLPSAFLHRRHIKTGKYFFINLEASSVIASTINTSMIMYYKLNVA